MATSPRKLDIAVMAVLGVVAIAAGVLTVALDEPLWMLPCVGLLIVAFLFAFTRSRGGTLSQ